MPDPLFKGARRDATAFGIPLVPLFCIVGSGTVIGTWSALAFGPIAYVVVVGVVAPVLIAVRLIALSDPHAFRLLQVRLVMWVQSPARTRRFWHGASAYAPVRIGRQR